MGERSYPLATEGSEVTRQLCDDTLARYADKLIGGCFREVDVASVTNTLEVRLTDDTAFVAVFSAWKTGYNEEAQRYDTNYGITISFARPYNPGEYWPASDPTDEATESGGLMFADDEPRDEDGVELALAQTRMVQEVWELMVNDADLRPYKNTSYEYYRLSDVEEPVDVEVAHPLGIDLLRLSRVPDEDIDHKKNEVFLSQTFSADDIKLIKAVLRRKSLKIARMITKIGGWDGVNQAVEAAMEADEPLIVVDLVDDPDADETSN